MDKIISCEFNIDTACVAVKYADGSMIITFIPSFETAEYSFYAVLREIIRCK